MNEPFARPTPVPDTLPRVGSRYIWLMVLAQLGVFVAFITPIAISLSIRLNTLAPGKEELLGYITGTGAGIAALTGPLIGTLSDQTRSRIGRRKPWMIGGMLLGTLSLLVMAQAQTPLMLGFGWVLAQLGWGAALSNLGFTQADRLPESQRGQVAGLVGFATQIGPVLGFILAGQLARNTLLLFLVPGLIGVVLLTLFIVFIAEGDSRNLKTQPLTFKALMGKYLYNPRQHPDFSWNWLGRFLFYFGLTLNTTFISFFFAQRLGIPLEKVATVVATLSGLGILFTTLGAIGGGFLSDKLRQRRIFVLIAGVVFALGAATSALAPTQTVLFAGSLMCSLAIGAFAAVDQALLLDVLPERDTDAGRYMGITGFATTLPQTFAPVIAPIFLGIGMTGTDKNYTLLYLISAVFTVLGGIVVMNIRKVR